MKLISDEVRILLDRMKEHPEEFAPSLDSNRWLTAFNRVWVVTNLAERFALWRARKQVIKANALRSVMDALLPRETPDKYVDSLYQAAVGTNIPPNFGAAQVKREGGLLSIGSGLGALNNSNAASISRQQQQDYANQAIINLYNSQYNPLCDNKQGPLV